MSKLMPTYEELVDKYRNELLNDEQLMDEFEERFEERLVANSKKQENNQRLN